jgi:DNA-binding MarR family transcriptional regulator
MEEITDGVSESAVRAAREVRVMLSRMLRRVRETYDITDLTPSQTSVLSRLDKDGDASVGDLAVAERVRHQSMASAIGILAERGLVSRRPDPGDGRRQLVSVSETGRKFLNDRRRLSLQWLTRAIEEQLTEAERQSVIEAMALLERLTRS